MPLIRSSGIEALPFPKSDPGALDNLRKLLNLENEAELQCICAYLVTALFPDGPFPVLALSGEQGTGKSTVAKIVRRLVDPNKADLRGPPRNEEDLVLDAQHSRLIVFDNVSHINGEMADNLCRLASGGGFSKRKLYSDDDQIIISVVNPIILTGIPNLLARADLADRAISITFQRIPIKHVRADSEIKAQFDLAAPGILALLLDGMVMALKHQLTVNIPHTPRMGDFVRRACGAASAFGWTEKDMFEALEGNRRETSEAVIEENPLALALFDLAGQIGPGGLTGTAKELLTRLSRSVSEETAKDRCWPRGPRQFGDTLRRMTGSLRHLDVDVEWHREGGTGARLITIRKTRRMGEELPPKNDNRKSPTVTIKRKRKIVIITKASSPASQTLEPPQPIPTTTSTVHGEDGGQ